jgi:multiple sugar transport system ATP-binding protein
MPAPGRTEFGSMSATDSCGLRIRDVTKRFGNFKALDGISLELDPGELVSIVGPSGCGKSTLLRVIAGLEDPDEGDILIGEAPMNAVSPKDRGVAFVFQNYALYPNLDCYDNIAAPLVMRELRAVDRLPVIGRLLPGARGKYASIRSRVLGVAGLLKIDACLNRRPSQLSGGQRQRVALGRALVRQPRLFLLDEPLANLDASLRVHTRSELAILQRRLRTTTLFVTHDQAEAMAISDRIAVMFAGRIRQIATPGELYRNPCDLDVARFMSQPVLNTWQARCIVPARVFVQGEQMVLQDAVRAGVEGVVGFRPEHCRLSRQHLPGTLAVVVERSEHAGSEAHVFLRLTATGDACVARIASAELGAWSAGARGWLGIDPDEAWFFPPDGARTGGERDAASHVA